MFSQSSVILGGSIDTSSRSAQRSGKTWFAVFQVSYDTQDLWIVKYCMLCWRFGDSIRQSIPRLQERRLVHRMSWFLHTQSGATQNPTSYCWAKETTRNSFIYWICVVSSLSLASVFICALGHLYLVLMHTPLVPKLFLDNLNVHHVVLGS